MCTISIKLVALRAMQAAYRAWLNRRWLMFERARWAHLSVAEVCWSVKKFTRHFSVKAAHISAAIAGNRAQWSSFVAAIHAAEMAQAAWWKRKALVMVIKRSRERLGRLETEKITLQKAAAWRAKLAQLDSERAFSIHVKTMSAGTFVLVVKPSLDVADIKDQVHDREKKIPTWQLRLHTNTNAKGHTRWMEEGELISEYDVRPGCTIFIDRDAADGAGRAPLHEAFAQTASMNSSKVRHLKMVQLLSFSQSKFPLYVNNI